MSHEGLYRHALYYDIAFSYRDVAAECDFFLACFRRHAGRPPRRVLELACGPGAHALELARRGLSVEGLDLSPEMIALLGARARPAGVDVTGVVADMTTFRLAAPVDLALCLLTSISYLVTSEALDAHFASVAASLAPGGLYIVENNHPRDFFSGEHFRPSVWTMSRDGITVETTWCATPPTLRLIEQTYEVTGRYVVDDHGQRFTIEDTTRLRMLLPLEMGEMAARQGLTLVDSLGDLSLGQPLDDSAGSWRAVMVFQKRA